MLRNKAKMAAKYNQSTALLLKSITITLQLDRASTVIKSLIKG